MHRVLLIIPSGTYRAASFLEAGRRIGAQIVIASDQPQALAHVMGDRFLLADLDEPQHCCEQIVAFASRSPLDAVIAVDDGGSLAAACASTRLGLRTNPPEAVSASMNKHTTRQLLAQAGMPQPRFALLESRSNDEVSEIAHSIGYPLIVKPCCLSASRGVIRVNDPSELLGAIERVRSILAEFPKAEKDAPVLIESYVEGEEVAIEAILRSGRLEVLAIFDKPDPLAGPYFEETIYVTPSRHSPAVKDLVVDAVASGCRALGLLEGPVHAEVRINDGSFEDPPGFGRIDVVVLEIAARTIGGRCGSTLSFPGNETLEELVLRHALLLSDDEPMPSAIGASGVMMLPIPRSGRLVGLNGQKDALSVEGISGLEVTVAPGRFIRALPEGDRYLGFLFAKGQTPEMVEASLRAGFAALDIEISDVKDSKRAVAT
jgi:biotin carboxylase